MFRSPLMISGFKYCSQYEPKTTTPVTTVATTTLSTALTTSTLATTALTTSTLATTELTTSTLDTTALTTSTLDTTALTTSTLATTPTPSSENGKYCYLFHFIFVLHCIIDIKIKDSLSFCPEKSCLQVKLIWFFFTV